MGVSAEILPVTLLPEWEAPEMTVRYQESKDGSIQTWVVPARRWSPVAEVTARITWTGCRGCEKGVSVEEVTLHLAHVDGRWKLLFSGPTNLM